MDERHLLACALRGAESGAGPAGAAGALAHLAGRNDALVTVKPLLDLVPDWATFLRTAPDDADYDAIRSGERTGRPLGSAAFVARLEKRLGRPLARQKPGPKPKDTADRRS